MSPQIRSEISLSCERTNPQLARIHTGELAVATNPPTAPAPDPSSKFNSTPTYMAVITGLNVNQDQLTKRQKLIAEIEQSLSAKYKSANRLMSYVMRFGHPRT